jgi:hypothetical protein
MGLFKGKANDETAKQLAEARDSLPRQVAAWTPEQRAQFADQSDRLMREQNGVSQRED